MGCAWYNPASYGSCAGDVAKSAARDAFSSIADSFGQAADKAVGWLWGQVNAATAVRLGGRGFYLELGVTAAITGSVAVALFAIQIIQSVLRREPAGLARAVRGLVVTFVGGGVAIAVVNLLLGATDGLCAGIVKVTAGTTLAGLGGLVIGGRSLTASVNGSAALLLLSLACVAATVIVYAALVVRKVLVIVTAIFAPLAFAGSLADITVAWTRRWIETTAALIASKLILVLILIAGYGILIHADRTGAGSSQKVTQVISGILVLFTAGLAPFMALKIVHFTGEQAHQLRAVGTSAAGVVAGDRAAQRAAPYWRHAVAMPATPAGGADTPVAEPASRALPGRNFRPPAEGRPSGGLSAAPAPRVSAPAAPAPAASDEPASAGESAPAARSARRGPYSSLSRSTP